MYTLLERSVLRAALRGSALWGAKVEFNAYFLILEIHFLILEIHFLILEIKFLILENQFLILEN